jgi:hypothetical protein
MEEISGTDRYNWSRIEVAVSVHNRLGTKTAHTENGAIPDITATLENYYQ